MQIQVLMPSPAVDFNFDSTSTSPFVSAPSSPHRFGTFFYSAPTSPSRFSSFHNEFAMNSTSGQGDNPPSTIPFNWEESPGVAKRKEPENVADELFNDDDDDDGNIITDDDYEFEFSGQLVDRPSLTADELFDGGKIKPLKPPPRLFYTDGRVGDSPRSSPRSPKRILKEALSFKEAFSPRQRKKDCDPFAEAIKQTGRRDSELPLRGREITQNSTPRHKSTRSLSPYRVSDMLFDGDNSQQNSKESSSTWLKLKDLLLFRSASEGSASTRKDSLKKYAMLKKQSSDDVKNSSFRSTDSSGSVGNTSRRRVSAHELHYTANRAVAEEMRRKTSLPYKSGLLGCLGFHHHVHGVNEISSSRRFGSVVMRRD